MTAEYLTAEQVATELGVHIQTAQRYFRDHGLPGRKIGHSWMTTREALNTWLIGLPPEPPDPGYGPANNTDDRPLENK